MKSEKPLRDGWIKLAPGETVEFHQDTPVSPDLHQMQHWIRNIRGMVLSASFDLESTLETAISSFFMGERRVDTPADQIARMDDFGELILKGMSFERKMSLIQKIAKIRMPPTDDYEKFANTINQVRVLRNMMAHYGTWLEAVKIEGTHRVKGFRAFIAKGDNVFEITEHQVKNWQTLLTEAIRQGEDFVRLLASAEQIS